MTVRLSIKQNAVKPVKYGQQIQQKYSLTIPRYFVKIY